MSERDPLYPEKRMGDKSTIPGLYLTVPDGPYSVSRRSSATSCATEDFSATLFRTYKRRWFYLFVISLAAFSNAYIWISFSTIADLAAQYFSVSYTAINYLSLIYLAAMIIFFVPCTLILEFIIAATFINMSGSVVRCLSLLPGVHDHHRYLIVLSGQLLCAIAQVFIWFIPVKFSRTWFTENQYPFAVSIGIGSIFLGVLVGCVLPPTIISHKDNIVLILYTGVALASLAFILSLGVLSSEPALPPCDIITPIQEPFFVALRQLFRSKNYIILLINSGIIIGCYQAFIILSQQIMCPFGYSNIVTGFALGCTLLGGIAGGLLVYYSIERDGPLEEISKSLYLLSIYTFIGLTLVIMHQFPYNILFLTFTFVGFTLTPILIISIELSLECVYPTSEILAVGVMLLNTQIFGIIMTFIYPKFARHIHGIGLYTHKCSVSPHKILNYTLPLWIMAAMIVTVTAFYLSAFSCKYKRRHPHRYSFG